MANNIYEFELSHDSIGMLIKNLKSYKKSLESIDKYILEELAKYTHERVVYYIATSVGDNYPPTDELINSIQISEYLANSIRVYTENVYAYYVEYGTGVIGAENAHPKSSEAGWTYDKNGHGEEGWVYKVGDNEYYWTQGEEAHQFMYRAFEDLKEHSEEIIIKVLKSRGIIK